MHPDYERALDFVNSKSPASDEEHRQWLAKTLIKISEKENEPFERAWTISKYWENNRYDKELFEVNDLERIRYFVESELRWRGVRGEEIERIARVIYRDRKRNEY